MKTLEQIKTEAGNLWPDIEAQISLLDNRIIQLVNGEGDRRQEAIAAQNAEHLKAIAAKDAQLADQATEVNLARQAAAESHAEAIAAKDAQLKAQDAKAWDTINAVDEAIAAKDAQHAADLAAAVEAEARAVHNRLDALVQAGQEAHAAGDLNAIGKVLDAAYGYTSGARKAKLEADLASAQAAVTAAADKLAAL